MSNDPCWPGTVTRLPIADRVTPKGPGKVVKDRTASKAKPRPGYKKRPRRKP
jgi:hypothetical protein